MKDKKTLSRQRIFKLQRRIFKLQKTQHKVEVNSVATKMVTVATVFGKNHKKLMLRKKKIML